MLHGRDASIAAIETLLEGAREGRSGTLLLHGEAGIGKTALLDYARDHANGMTVLSGVGHQSEAGYAFALLDQVARPIAGFMDGLPDPQARALRSALGLSDEPVHDRFLVSAAMLTLLSEAAERQPVLCIIDDLQWVDRGSVDGLAFVARRLHSEGVALLIAERTEGEVGPSVPDLPHLAVQGLERDEALALIRERRGDSLRSVEDKLLASSQGNPLALIELPRVLDTPAFSDASFIPDPLPVGAGIRRSFLEQVRRTSADAQMLLVVIAADPDATIGEVLAVAERLGVATGAEVELESSGLVHASGEKYAFRHPLVRSAVYHDASPVARRRVHATFAATLGANRRRERQTWHRSLGSDVPDQDIASALEDSAETSRSRGAMEAASRSFQRASERSVDPESSAWRMVSAAETAQQAGQPDRARALMVNAETLHNSAALHAHLDELRGGLELRTGVPADAHAFLVAAARRVASADPARAIRMLTHAGEAASYAGDRELVVSTGIQAAELLDNVSGTDRLPALVLYGAGKVVSGQADEGRAICLEAVHLAELVSDARDLVWASIAAQYAGDEDRQHGLAARAVAAARSAGQVAMLPYALEFLGLSELSSSRFDAARATATEGLSLARELRQQNSIGRHLAILAWVDAVRGDSQSCQERTTEVLAIAAARGLGLQGAAAHWALGLLELTLGRAAEASEHLERLRSSSPGDSHPGIVLLATPDAIEAAVRSGRSDEGRHMLTAFGRFAGPSGPAWAQALARRCFAMLAPDEATADNAFTEALVLHQQANRPLDRARTHLLYGEHLRRVRRRVDARSHLREASAEFERLGVTPWVQRAHRELRATGETAHRREDTPVAQLTPQEFQIVNLVSTGASNRDVAASLFLSPRTVEYHLSKVFTKLAVSSRSELAGMNLSDGTGSGE